VRRKALLDNLGLPIPKIHDLAALHGLMVAHHAGLRSIKRGLSFLTEFAVDTRYPGHRASKREATAALRWAGKVRDMCRSLLGLRSRKRKSR
jgi:HEPN domain-containing protein